MGKPLSAEHKAKISAALKARNAGKSTSAKKSPRKPAGTVATKQNPILGDDGKSLEGRDHRTMSNTEKVRVAEAMFGTGSKQHKKAQEKWSDKPVNPAAARKAAAPEKPANPAKESKGVKPIPSKPAGAKDDGIPEHLRYKGPTASRTPSPAVQKWEARLRAEGRWRDGPSKPANPAAKQAAERAARAAKTRKMNARLNGR